MPTRARKPAFPTPIHARLTYNAPTRARATQQLFLRGNHEFNWYEDAEGYTVVPVEREVEGEDGVKRRETTHYYARLDKEANELVPTKTQVSVGVRKNISVR